MPAAEVQISLCDYSSHRQPFRQNYRNGLDTYILRLQAEGEARALVDGRMQRIVPGDLLLFAPGQSYELLIGTEQQEKPVHSEDYYVMCTGRWMDEWWKAGARPAKTRIADDGKVGAVWRQLVLEIRRIDGGSPDILARLLQALCLMLDRALAEAPAAASKAGLLALRMRSYVEAHATGPLKLEDVARHAGISVTRAVHLFKAETGCSIIAYAQQIRLALALQRMRSSQQSLEQIAEETGFGSYSYFHRIFKEKYGVAPGSYRRP